MNKNGENSSVSTRIARLGAAALLAVFLTIAPGLRAHAGAPTQVAVAEDSGEPWDPLEPFNRMMFGINEMLLLIVVTPIVAPYEGTAPAELKEAVGHFIGNLQEPVTLVNNVLQGDLDRAWVTLARFVINSTIGIGGLFDQATDMGYEGRKEDFGQTLAVWGVPETFYLVLPGLGPLYPRDGVGKLVDGYISPWQYVAPDEFTNTTTWVGRGQAYANVMPELDKVRKTSVDYYAAIRSMYTQKRRAEVLNGEQTNVPAIPDFSSIDDSDAPVAGTPGLVYPLPPKKDSDG